jgi:hypothetical protein
LYLRSQEAEQHQKLGRAARKENTTQLKQRSQKKTRDEVRWVIAEN